jgi:hypothetical protein
MSEPGLPFDVLFVMMIVVPVIIAVFFSLFAFKGMAPLVFRCLRCSGVFHRPPHHDFPARCPHCDAADWSS